VILQGLKAFVLILIRDFLEVCESKRLTNAEFIRM
jgi:hypothetical protein